MSVRLVLTPTQDVVWKIWSQLSSCNNFKRAGKKNVAFPFLPWKQTNMIKKWEILKTTENSLDPTALYISLGTLKYIIDVWIQ